MLPSSTDVSFLLIRPPRNMHLNNGFRSSIWTEAVVCDGVEARAVRGDRHFDEGREGLRFPPKSGQGIMRLVWPRLVDCSYAMG